jgi:hypothetical protein
MKILDMKTVDLGTAFEKRRPIPASVKAHDNLQLSSEPEGNICMTWPCQQFTYSHGYR